MSSPKKPSADPAATLLANPVPGPGPATSDRRTAALPQAPVPTSAPHDRTMTFDPQVLQDRTRPPMQTVITPHKPVPAATHPSPYASPGPAPAPLPATASNPSPPPRVSAPRQQRAIARWFVGPVIAILIGAATMLVAGFISAAQPHPVTRGKLRISSEPEGATVLIEGKVHPHATPTVIEGDIGATLHVGFKLDGYLDRDAEVFVGEGERPFRVRLERRDAPPTPPPSNVEPDNEDMLAPTPAPQPVGKPKKDDDRPRSKKDPSTKHNVATKNDPIAAPIGGTGTLSVHVRPWAIVYVDGAKIRQTPVSGHSLTAGLHSIELVNDDLHKKEKVTVEIRANANEEIHRNWE